MKSNKTLLMIGLTLAVITFSGVIFAADQTGATSAKPNSNSVSTSTAVKVKLTKADIEKIVLKLYKDAKIREIKLIGKIYTVKIHTADENRTLEIGGNTGNILKNISAVATSTVKNTGEAVTPIPINANEAATLTVKNVDTPAAQAPTPTVTPATN